MPRRTCARSWGGSLASALGQLGATAAAAHGIGRILLQRPRQRRTRGRHLRQLVEPLHETPIDPILPTPDPGAFQGERAAGRYGAAVPGSQDGQEPALCAVALERPVLQAPTQILSQHGPFPHRKDPGLGTRLTHQMGDITGGEDRRVRGGSEMAVDPNESAHVRVQPG